LDKPRIEIKLRPIDRVIEAIGVLALILLIALPLYYFDKLPETIPRHFGPNGEPDAYSGKSIIWTLPIIGVIMYFGLYWLNKYPHVFNYPKQVTTENARSLYTYGTRMIRTLNTIIACLFTYITYATIQVALGYQTGLGNWFMSIFITLIFGSIGYFSYKSSKVQSEVDDFDGKIN